MSRKPKQVVVIVHDLNDDKAIQDGLRAYCGPGSGRLLISPAPLAFSDPALAGYVLQTLGVRRDRRRRLQSLRCDALIELMRKHGISELYVLRAHILYGRGWSALKLFARSCDLRLHLVVHGTSRDLTYRLLYVSECRLIRRTIAEPLSAPHWTHRPSYSAVRGRRRDGASAHDDAPDDRMAPCRRLALSAGSVIFRPARCSS